MGLLDSWPQEQDGFLEDELKAVLEKISDMVRASGVPIRAHRPETWIYYRSLPNLQKHRILESCKIYHRICKDTIDDGRSIADTRSLVWCSFRHFGFVPCSDLMDQITEDLVVEVYDADGRQVFRNFKFMEFCSYTLADVLFYTWKDLFDRDDAIVNQIIKEVGIVLSGSVHSSIPSITPAHETTEMFSESKHSFEMKFQFLSPLFSKTTKKPAGFIITAKARVLSSGLFKSETVQEPQLRAVDSL